MNRSTRRKRKTVCLVVPGRSQRADDIPTLWCADCLERVWPTPAVGERCECVRPTGPQAHEPDG